MYFVQQYPENDIFSVFYFRWEDKGLSIGVSWNSQPKQWNGMMLLWEDQQAAIVSHKACLD